VTPSTAPRKCSFVGRTAGSASFGDRHPPDCLVCLHGRHKYCPNGGLALGRWFRVRSSAPSAPSLIAENRMVKPNLWECGDRCPLGAETASLAYGHAHSGDDAPSAAVTEIDAQREPARADLAAALEQCSRTERRAAADAAREPPSPAAAPRTSRRNRTHGGRSEETRAAGGARHGVRSAARPNYLCSTAAMASASVR
jgi:hypothetical protein